MKLATHPDGSMEHCFTVQNLPEASLLGLSVAISDDNGNHLAVFEDELTGLINALVAMRDVILPLQKVLV